MNRKPQGKYILNNGDHGEIKGYEFAHLRNNLLKARDDAFFYKYCVPISFAVGLIVVIVIVVLRS